MYIYIFCCFLPRILIFYNNNFMLWFQNVSEQSDHCAFIGPMARLIKGDCHLDIFYYELRDDGSIIFDHEDYDTGEIRTIYDYDNVFPLKKCMFGGVEMTCPGNPLRFLETVYGDNVLPSQYKCVNSTWIIV